MIKELPPELGRMAVAYASIVKDEQKLLMWYQAVAQKFDKTVAEAEEACREGLKKSLEELTTEYDAATVELFKERSKIKDFLEGVIKYD